MMASETDSPILSKAQLKEQKKAEHERVREITRRKTAQTSWPHHIVFANEKGGTGKSTTAIHVAVALSFLGHKVAIIDLGPAPAHQLSLFGESLQHNGAAESIAGLPRFCGV